MADFHFTEDYERHVRALKENHPLAEAMSLAVGGDYERFGKIMLGISAYAGLRNGMFVLDLGCGSGRAAKAFSERFTINYLGLDVVQDLLDYASSVCPSHFQFVLNRSLTLPAADSSVDMVVGFSIFTHLLHEETYLYLEEIHRTLKPGGVLVFSFLEFHMPSHWTVFAATVESQRNSTTPHLNMFMERNQIEAWARHLGYRVHEFLDGDRPTPLSEALGQSVAILKPLK